jgi:hypothetical protein
MNQDRLSVLTLLAEGKVTPQEAERLLSAMEGGPGRSGAAPGDAQPKPKYLRVLVDTLEGGDGPTKVNVRVPLQLLRAGVRLSSIIPPLARERVNAAMAENGVPFDINALKPENIDELIDQLNDLTVDVDKEHTKVRVFCE